MNHHRQLRKHTTALLAELGHSPDEVATTLEDAGVHGVPRDNNTCAVALYLGALLGSESGIRSVRVGHCSLVMELTTPDRRPAGKLLVQLPKPVRHFVAAFDERRYPTLTRQQVPQAPQAPQTRQTPQTPPPVPSTR